jgi:CheY-like chemotaxis protein
MQTGELDSERTRQAAETIDRAARVQAKLIDDLLDSSRILTGKMRIEARPVDLGPVIDAAVETARVGADAKQIQLEVALDPHAGPVSGDPARLQQVVWNLVSNAVKFTPRGGRVRIATARIDSHVEVTVSDDGQGIEPSLLPFVFERFWQAERGSGRRHGGLGLGLAIVRHLVELHGGTVHVSSGGIGSGAEFSVRLPSIVVSPLPIRSERPPDGSPAVKRLQDVRVLVIEDDQDSREATRAVLEWRGAEVQVAASSREAFAVLDRWLPEVIVSDVGMPGDDGYTLMRRLRARPPERGGRIPALALTGFAGTEDRTRLIEAGFQIHLTKPADPGELVAAVASLVGRA